MSTYGEPALSRDTAGEGPSVILLHGLTAVGTQVIHGSRRLERSGHRTVSFDARAHGSSEAPPAEIPLETAYSYAALSADLDRIVAEAIPRGEVFHLAGSSMGAHTAARYALDHPERVAGLALIGPAYSGEVPGESDLRLWSQLSEGLRNAGSDGFVEAFSETTQATGQWRERLVALARQRIELHEHPDDLANALWWIPRSRPFGGLSDLERLQIPALVIGSNDDADPGHPAAVAEAWAEAIPEARLLLDEAGTTPTAWQGGRLCDLISEFMLETE